MEDAASWHVEPSRSGEPTVIVDGKALHSRFDPIREAEKTAASVPPEAAIVVLGGLGLGYVAEALIRQAPDRRLVIAEADETMPERAASVRDLAAIFTNGNASIVSGGNPADIKNLLIGGPAGSLIHLIVWRPSEESNPQWYGELRDAVEETARRRQVNAQTLDRFGRLWVRNLSVNAAILPGALSLATWKDAFKGIPALILAGGPSLETILEKLPALMERYLIIAVDTAVSAVLRSGISPDIIAAVDPQYWNTRHLDRCARGTENALILAESATHPTVFRSLKGRPWLTRTRFPLGTVLEDAAGIEGELKAGGSVATAAWDLARHLGCSTLTIAGLDLGFPDGITHYSGSLSRERPHFYSRRTSPAQDLFFHALRDASPRLVESSDGGLLLTDLRMDVYAAWFSESVLSLQDRSPALVGGKGRKIQGMEVVDISEMMEKAPQRLRIDALLEQLRNAPGSPLAEKQIQRVLASTVVELENLESLALHGVEITKRARTVFERGRDAGELLNQLEVIDRKLLSGEGRDIISFLIQPLILELGNQSSERDDPLGDSLRLYSEIARSAAYHLLYLRKAVPQA